MATLAVMLGAQALKGGLDFFAGRKMANAYKTAGTTLADAANREAATALTLPGMVNPALLDAYGNAASDVRSQAFDSATALGQQALEAGGLIRGAATGANAFLNPYMTAGSGALSTMSQLAGQAPMTFDPSVVPKDPSFAFRLQQGQSGLMKQAAARGASLGGGALKALTAYGQNLASTEYGNAYQRALQTFQANANQRQLQFSNLSNLAQMGYGASGQAGQNLIGAEQFGATLGQRALAQGGDWQTRAAQLAGNYGVEGATAITNNILSAENVARQARLGGAQATAQSQLGAAGANAQNWANLGGSLFDMAMLYNQNRGGGDIMFSPDRTIARSPSR